LSVCGEALAEVRSPSSISIEPENPLGLRVLVAEDNMVNQRVLIRLLGTWGCEVDAVGNGRLAVDATIRTHYDAVLMDMQMPEMDGVEAAKAIRFRERVTGRHIPIIAITANATLEDRECCLSAGMDD